jgi:hypothetical protein
MINIGTTGQQALDSNCVTGLCGFDQSALGLGSEATSRRRKYHREGHDRHHQRPNTTMQSLTKRLQNIRLPPQSSRQ